MSWWKILAIILLVYALTVGMLVPLRPGIHSSEPSSASAGERLELIISGYNTRFGESEGVNRAWLKLTDNHFLKAEKTTVLDDQTLQANFDVPSDLPGSGGIEVATLIVDNEIDGTIVFPSAVFITPYSLASSTSVNVWSSTRPEGLAPADDFRFPYRNILVETIRNTFYHVSLWFAMFIILLISVVYAARYLIKGQTEDDRRASALIKVGVLFGILGLATGSIWARYTWGTFWTADVKLNMAAVSMLIYVGYILLRQSIDDRDRRATVSSAYAIFAYFAMIPLLFIVPRLTDSLHPGNGGNPALGGEDLDHTLRLVFYPAIIGFTLLGLWLAQLTVRLKRIRDRALGLD